ncbi:hypothetical protein [Alcanivorax hongdengensis]|uniref:hypothetical protein n=1 Tax=Alcanivorax hongdengensis TaxID=519051 RepID=UPI0012F99701|nr:hypothetical protein [Alcanivorax hongdengensis]
MNRYCFILLMVASPLVHSESKPVAIIEVTPWAYILNGHRSEYLPGLTQEAQSLPVGKWVVYTAPCIDKSRTKWAENMAAKHSRMNYEVIERGGGFCEGKNSHNKLRQ